MITKDIIYELGGLYHNHICYDKEPINQTSHTLSGSNIFYALQLQTGVTIGSGSLVVGGSGTGLQVINLETNSLGSIVTYPILESGTIKDIA